jgi:Siphovirus ReqiPepy6 Gp37-like protein
MPTPAMPAYRVIVRDVNRVQRGEIQRFHSITLIPRFNDVGSWTLTIPQGHPQASKLTDGGWLTFLAGDTEVCSGQIRGRKTNWDQENPGAGTLTVYGPTIDQVIADRLAYQVPGSAATSQSATDYDRRSGAGETVIKAYVNVNAGPGALAARRTSGLLIETDLGRGASIKGSARMDNLLTFLQPLASAAGPLGFRTVFNADNTMTFQVYVPVDRSGRAKFGTQLGNLVSYERVTEASKSSNVVVGGSGDGTARVFREINDTTAQAAWGIRSEAFVDRRDTSDTTEMDQAGTEATVTDGPTSGLSIKTVDTPYLVFGRDYFLGDIVSLPEFAITDRLTEVQITWASDQPPSATSTVGTRSTTGTPLMLNRLADLNARIAKLEASK